MCRREGETDYDRWQRRRKRTGTVLALNLIALRVARRLAREVRYVLMGGDPP